MAKHCQYGCFAIWCDGKTLPYQYGNVFCIAPYGETLPYRYSHADSAVFCIAPYGKTALSACEYKYGKFYKYGKTDLSP